MIGAHNLPFVGFLAGLNRVGWLVLMMASPPKTSPATRKCHGERRWVERIGVVLKKTPTPLWALMVAASAVFIRGAGIVNDLALTGP